jgi:hypothetical protein
MYSTRRIFCKSLFFLHCACALFCLDFPSNVGACVILRTYLGGEGILISGVSLLVLSLLSLLFIFAAGQFDAAEASVAREGSWIEALLPCLC